MSKNRLIDAYVWTIDSTDEEVAGNPGWNTIVAPRHIRQFAHKIFCCNRYKTIRKRNKAMRRLFRMAGKEIMDSIIKHWNY